MDTTSQHWTKGMGTLMIITIAVALLLLFACGDFRYPTLTGESDEEY